MLLGMQNKTYFYNFRIRRVKALIYEGLSEDERILCRCECGKECNFDISQLKKGETKLAVPYICSVCGKEHDSIGDFKEYCNRMKKQMDRKLDNLQKKANKVWIKLIIGMIITLILIIIKHYD